MPEVDMIGMISAEESGDCFLERLSLIRREKVEIIYPPSINPLSAIGKYTYHWKFDLFMVLDP